MTAGLLLGAVGVFAVTNLDDIVLLTLYFGRATGTPGAGRKIVLGQYLGFAAILVVSFAASIGAALVPRAAIGYLGLLPIAIGIRAALVAWRDHRAAEPSQVPASRAPLTARTVATITFANGGDNIALYVPVFAAIGVTATLAYTGIFLVLVAVWCAAGRFLATRRPLAMALDRWGHILLPAVLVGIGVGILVRGGAFGL